MVPFLKTVLQKVFPPNAFSVRDNSPEGIPQPRMGRTFVILAAHGVNAHSWVRAKTKTEAERVGKYMIRVFCPWSGSLSRRKRVKSVIGMGKSLKSSSGWTSWSSSPESLPIFPTRNKYKSLSDTSAYAKLCISRSMLSSKLC